MPGILFLTAGSVYLVQVHIPKAFLCSQTNQDTLLGILLPVVLYSQVKFQLLVQQCAPALNTPVKAFWGSYFLYQSLTKKKKKDLYTKPKLQFSVAVRKFFQKPDTLHCFPTNMVLVYCPRPCKFFYFSKNIFNYGRFQAYTKVERAVQ